MPVALGGLVALLAVGATAGAALLEPVAIDATTPEIAEAKKPFRLEVAVEAEAGALDIAAGPLTLGVKLASECGGSFVGTHGETILERTLPTPTAGAAYAQTISASVTAASTGDDTVCAFLQDSQERQFATDTEAEVDIVSPGAAPACRKARKRVEASTRKLKRLDRRIATLKRESRHTKGAAHKKAAHKLRHLRTQKRKVQHQRKRLTKRATTTCS
ncbi:MAG: hypothetical protein QM729_00480 [Solirubrobacterales bacterium]